MRALFACVPAAAARLWPEAASAGRTPFQRDRDRVLHSSAFRRLALKTQVFMPGEGDHHRTRLTHSLEVAQVARSMSRALGLDEDLTEALALAHDLGHGPFGHTGESALDTALAPFGGFDHNVQSLRVVVDLEQRYLDFDGLNLTWDALEGLAKRGGPVAAPGVLLHQYDAALDLRLGQQPGAEAQVAAVADDIAYNAHDLEDGLRAGLIGLDDIVTVAPLADVVKAIEGGRTAIDATRMPAALARTMIGRFVEAALAETRRRLAEAQPADVAAVRRLPHPIVALPADALDASAAVKDFLFARLYRHPRLVATRKQAHRLVGDLTRALLERPALLPPAWAVRAQSLDDMGCARLVGDYVAGMTDRHAIREHRRLFGAPVFDAPVDFV